MVIKLSQHVLVIQQYPCYPRFHSLQQLSDFNYEKLTEKDKIQQKINIYTSKMMFNICSFSMLELYLSM